MNWLHTATPWSPGCLMAELYAFTRFCLDLSATLTGRSSGGKAAASGGHTALPSTSMATRHNMDMPAMQRHMSGCRVLCLA